VNLDNRAFERALCSSDVEVLSLEIATSWTSAAISGKIDKLRQTYQISYALSDEGNNLQGAWKMQDMTAINDCTHVWAKSRFHQVFQYIDWSENIKGVAHKLSQEQQDELSFITDHGLLLYQLKAIKQLVKRLNDTFKTKGLSHQTIRQSLDMLTEDLPNLPQTHQFKELAIQFLTRHRIKIEDDKTYLCCSDIIEPTFGKYKQTIAKGNKNMTELVLALAALGKKTTAPEIKKLRRK
jgi:hypothetical protein